MTLTCPSKIQDDGMTNTDYRTHVPVKVTGYSSSCDSCEF